MKSSATAARSRRSPRANRSEARGRARKTPAITTSRTIIVLWSRHLFLALCRRYGLAPYRYHRQRAPAPTYLCENERFAADRVAANTSLFPVARAFLTASPSGRHQSTAGANAVPKAHLRTGRQRTRARTDINRRRGQIRLRQARTDCGAAGG